MKNSTAEIGRESSEASPAYTVICKSGERGIAFSDARLAALAFLRAQAQDRPFVLRHQGNASIVIAFAKSGAKQILPGKAEDDFRDAYVAVATSSGEFCVPG